MLHRCLSILIVSLALSISFFNAYQVANYAVNFSEISEELCVNRDTDITTCNGMCYLSDHIIAPKSVDQNVPLQEVNVNLSFLFYFMIEQKEPTNISTSKTFEFIVPFQRENQYYGEIPVPPPSLG